MTPAERLRGIIETGDPGTPAGVQLTRWVCRQLPKTDDGEYLAYILQDTVKNLADAIDYDDPDVPLCRERALKALDDVERQTLRLATS